MHGEPGDDLPLRPGKIHPLDDTVVGSARTAGCSRFHRRGGLAGDDRRVIRTNIGAGFVVFFGGPVILVLLVSALAYAVYLLSGANHAKNPPINPNSK